MSIGYDADLVEVDGIYDFQIDADGDIKTTDFFDTAILMSLWCERRANSSDMPINNTRRGWIGNESFENFENGSKLWLYEQARITRDTLNGIETAVSNGLQWFIDEGIATNIEVSTELQNSKILLLVIIERPNSNVDRRYYELWNNTGL